MAARRGKSQAKRNGSGGIPSWAWLVIGVVLTLAAVLLVPRYLKSEGGDGFFRPKPNPNALPAAVSGDGEAIAPDTAPATAASKQDPDKSKPTQYDFYTLLPGQEVAMSDAELAASTKAEAETATRAQKLAAASNPTSVGSEPASALPAPVADKSSTPSAPPAAATTATAKPAIEAAASTVSAHYILQAGAFGASGDAEAIKAKIAMLGLNARVESAQIGDKTVYRVRMGPYGSASELADAKAKLTSGGLQAMAVKTH